MKEEPSKKLTVAVIIISWNTKELLQGCLSSIFAPEEKEFSYNLKVVVVDNASGDGSQELVLKEFPQVHLIINKDNLGFAKANNQALEWLTEEEKEKFDFDQDFLLFLNSDLEISPSSLNIMVKFLLADQKIQGCVPKLLNPDGSLQRSCRGLPTGWRFFCEYSGLARLFKRNPHFSGYRMSYWDQNDTRAVEQPMFSCFLVGAKVFREVGALDEQFPIYFNDVDWFKRAYERKFEFFYLHEVEVVHHYGASTKKLGFKKILLWNKGLKDYLLKYHLSKNIFSRIWLHFFLLYSIFLMFLKESFSKILDWVRIKN